MEGGPGGGPRRAGLLRRVTLAVMRADGLVRTVFRPGLGSIHARLHAPCQVRPDLRIPEGRGGLDARREAER